MSKDLLVTIDSEGPLPGQLRTGGRPARVELARFAELAERNATSRDYERVILVGDGEALEQHGFAFATAAREGGFTHVRLDTSARRLTQAQQVRAVVMAGVNEFSVGLHGDCAELHDQLSGRPGDFAKVQTCLERLSKHEVRVVVDTIVTTANLAALAQIVELAIAKGASRVALWSYLPAEDTPETRALIVSLDALIPALRPAIARCREAEVEVVVRHVPACLLGDARDILDNTRPDALDGVRPGRPLAQFNCLHEAKCEHAEACLGLHHAYVNAHGWELERLQPTPRVRPWRERDRSVERTTGGAAGPRGHASWLALLGPHAERVAGVSLTRTEARYPMQMPDGTRFVLVLSARDDDARTFIQSASFNLAYTDVEGPAQERAIATFVEPVLRTIAANDDGSLCLDAKA
ncbi:pyrroloquinoline quinone biosynthesis protein PqqE [Enhygromyxa salina]|uniref:Pyrroloquinoline quinone biosynthesis protein PqqE n=1 Tax=Enhygromyxa salina TaxID=215803 RepID=A0A2S9XXD2_9BACT|nr:radical SAM protein [Enhygromyxa salina]PRP97512.1 pyrroloquinoline quinone biosynthesis protein PqqE [Enhygromyxa salina]